MLLIFSNIRTKYRHLRSKSPHSVLIWENTDRAEKTPYLDTFHAVKVSQISYLFLIEP